MPVFHKNADVFPDLEVMNFERSIFDRLPALKLRSSDQQMHRHVVSKFNDVEQRELAESIHKMIVSSPHQDLMELAAEGNQMRLVLPTTRQDLHQRVQTLLNHNRTARVPAGASKVHQISNMILSQASIQDMDAILQGRLDRGMISVGFSEAIGSNQSLSHCSDYISMVSLSSRGVHFGGSKGKANVPLDSKAFEACVCNSQGILGSRFEAKCSEGFGTAPIWYQQSMATGPPR